MFVIRFEILALMASQIGSDRYRYERVYFVTDTYGNKRVDKKIY